MIRRINLYGSQVQALELILKEYTGTIHVAGDKQAVFSHMVYGTLNEGRAVRQYETCLALTW